jgi:LacI family transcriptional regulator
MSIKEIKKITGFSYSTISRVLSGKSKEFRISDAACRKILHAAKTLNYRPNILARSLRLKKTMTIGLIVSDIQNPFFGELASRIENQLHLCGYSTFLCNTNEIPKNEEFYLKILVDRQVDGIIIAPIHTEEWAYMESLGQDTPIILVDRIFYKTELPWVTSENMCAAERLTEELLGLGYRRIAFLGGTRNTYITNVRCEGYLNAHKKYALKTNKNLMMFKGYSKDAGEEMMREILNRTPDLEAVVCVNNLVFFGAIKAVNEHELKHKKQVMMAGFDIDGFCSMFNKPMISADQDLRELAGSAVALLLSQIADSKIEEKHRIIPISINKYRLKNLLPK